MNRFNPMFLRMGTSAMVFDKPNEGGGGSGGEDDAAAKAAAETEAAKVAEEQAALKAAEDAEAEAKAAADKAKAEAEGSDDPKLKALAEEKAELVREVMDKKSKLKDAQTEAKEARDKLALFGDVDPDKVKKLLQAEADSEKAALEAKGEFDRVKEMMASEHEKERKAWEEEKAALMEAASSSAKTIDDLTVGSSFGNSKFISEDLILSPAKARQLYGDRFGIEDGKTVAYDKPRSSKDRTVMVDANGNALDFDSAMKRIIDADPDKDTMIRTKKAPGAGSKTPVAPGKSKPKNDGTYGASRIAASLSAAGEI